MKIIDPMKTLDGKGITVEILPLAAKYTRFRLRFWWRFRSRRWWADQIEHFVSSRFRLRVLDEAGYVVLDVDDYQLYLTLLYSGIDKPDHG